MITLLTRDTNEIFTYDGETWVKPVERCPAPCCDIACEEHPDEADCNHTTHEPGQGGYCVFQADQDGYTCLAYHGALLGATDCIHSVADQCACANLLYTEQRKHLPGRRGLGVKKAQFERRKDDAPTD
jgi:hypothetical protein